MTAKDSAISFIVHMCTLQGEFFSIANHQEAPFTPNPLPAVNGTDKMMYVWLTEYMADTAGFVYQQSGELNYNVTPSMVSRMRLTQRWV